MLLSRTLQDSQSGQLLLPSQQRALQELQDVAIQSSVISLAGRAGTGKSWVAREYVRLTGADYLDLADYYSMIDQEPKEDWDKRICELIEERIARCQTLVLDDFVFLRGTYSSARSWKLFDTFFAELAEKLAREGKMLVRIGRTTHHSNEHLLDQLNEEQDIDYIYRPGMHPLVVLGPGLDEDDYRAVFDLTLGQSMAEAIDEEIVYLFAPQLSIRQLSIVAALARKLELPSTEDVIAIIRRHILQDNTRLAEVEALSFDLLPGSEEIASVLETHVILPFEKPQLARSLGLKAKRGVMLFGLPGTGKTAIGRALAHRMKGKFYLIDGSISSEPAHVFLMQVKQIIRRAVRNAPSVLFIDDADSLFAIPHIAGLVRYLLSILDGMESENAGKVCVMMTVMDAAKVPDALTRSGRVELWLQTKPPVASTRERILERWSGDVLPQMSSLDFPKLAELTEGLVPADLRRVMGDARLLCARSVRDGVTVSSAEEYAEQAIINLRSMRGRMAQVLEGVSA